MRIRYSLMTAAVTVGLVCCLERSGAGDDDERLLRRRTLEPRRDEQPVPLRPVERAGQHGRRLRGADPLDDRQRQLPASARLALGSTDTGDYNTALGRFAGVDVIERQRHDRRGRRARSARANAGRSHRGGPRGSRAATPVARQHRPSAHCALLTPTRPASRTPRAGSRALRNSNGNYNSAFGYQALRRQHERASNTALGRFALRGEHDAVARTPPPASTRCRPTRRVSTTSPTAISLWSSTRPGRATRRWAATPCSATPTATTTSPSATRRSSTTRWRTAASPSARNALHPATGAPATSRSGTTPASQLTNGTDNIEIGNQGVAAEAKTIRIGTQGTQTRAVHRRR